jgi:phosphohistidine phosphatase
MKRLYLLRHAKSAWPEGVADHRRPLAPRGIAAAGLMARHMQDHGLLPQATLVSTAVRTRETFALLAQTLKLSAAFTDDIYDAAPKQLLALVRAADDANLSLMLVGHNPGIAGLAAALVSPTDSDAEALARLAEKVPTAALAVIDLPVERWRDVKPGKARLAAFVTPHQLGGVDED